MAFYFLPGCAYNNGERMIQTMKEILEELKQQLGTHKAVSERLGIPRRTYYAWRNTNSPKEANVRLAQLLLDSIRSGNGSSSPPPAEDNLIPRD
jgi:hypothetical protein